MRSSIVLLTFFSGIKAFSCEGAMKSFKVECAAQDRYQRLLTEFRNRSLAPQDLKGYQVAHALGKSIFESSKNEFSKINETDLSQNKKWKIWKNGQNFINQIDKVFLDFTDILKLHTALYADASVNDQGVDIGQIRTQSGITNPSVSYSCGDQFLDDDRVNLINDYDLTSVEGHPLLSLENLKSCKDRNYSSGILYFYKGASIKIELVRWLTDFNDHITRFENDEAYRNSTPYTYLADMHRWFLALSPFNSGNSEIADALISYAFKRLGLPSLVINDSLSPIFESANENREKVAMKLQEALAFLDKCLMESKRKSPSAECTTLK